MNYAILLCGGTGTRLGANIPKQYLRVNGKAIMSYCMISAQKHPDVDSIVIVAHEDWRDFIKNEIDNFGVDKFFCFADAGESRQHSVLSGMKAIIDNAESVSADDKVIIHDAARPNLSEKLITDSFDFGEYDCTLPVINVTDTTYYSEDGKEVTQLLNRDKLYGGQTPEGFYLKQFYDVNMAMTDEQLSAVRGSCQAAFEAGLKVRMIPGDTNNYKITTIEDYDRFRMNNEKN